MSGNYFKNDLDDPAIGFGHPFLYSTFQEFLRFLKKPDAVQLTSLKIKHFRILIDIIHIYVKLYHFIIIILWGPKWDK